MVLTEAINMKQQITGSKLGRLIYLLENHSNAKVLGDALIAKNVTGATAVQVKEVGGSHLEFRFKLPTDTDTSWLKKRAIRITKKFVDDYNQAAQEAYDEAVANNENPEELDLDSDETKIAIGTAWIRQSVKGNSKDIDADDDKVEIIALSGKIYQTNFLIEVQEAGLITDHGKKYQLRLKSARSNISTVLPTDPITVTSLNHGEIRQQLIAALELPEVVEGHESEVKRLFEEDILLQMTHYKVGGRYVAIVSNAALDYYGEIQFSVVEETEEPENP